MHQIRTLGVPSPTAIEVADLFFLEGPALDGPTVERIASTLLYDPILQDLVWAELGTAPEAFSEGRSVEVSPLPGVTDSVAESLLRVAHGLGFSALHAAATGTRVRLHGLWDEAAVQGVARGLLANEVVQRFTVDSPVPPPFVADTPAPPRVERVPLRGADDAALLAISQSRRLSLNLDEMRAVRSWFEGQGREPTDLELEMIAQTWSEHCVHKTFRALIDHTDADGSNRQINGIFRTYIKAATEQADPGWLRSVFVDNAGIVAFDEDFDLAFKVETHNHPSALEPFGGANTGVGGVVRDVMGVSARPIATTDVLCFGPPDLAPARLPSGCLHPRRVADGVVAGVGDYGNKMGIPTVNGAVLYHDGYTANPLVYCGCLGILPRDSHPTSARAGDLIVVLGGRTGRDGLRGATFSSMEMDTSTADIAGSSVQIGHPIHEKQVLEVLLAARDAQLYSAITDCGAGGLSSAIGEMGRELGAEVQLTRVPLKYSGLMPWEIWLSEAQERMVLAVPPQHLDALQALADRHGCELTVPGTFSGDGWIRIRHGEQLVGELDAHWLHEGIPQMRLRSAWNPPPSAAFVEPNTDFNADLLALLATPDIRSKEDIVRRYDHEVQGGTTVRPFVGPGQDGPSDAAVLCPLDSASRGRSRGLALSVGINPHYGALDPYRMALAAVDEAVRNLVAVGADPDQVALLDNFCWGNPRLPDRLGALVRCAEGCYDAAVALHMPYISGKDSLNNEYTGEDGQKHAIPGTLLISALGIVPDVDRTVTMDLKDSGNLLFLVGLTRDELGASARARLHGQPGGEVPAPPAQQQALFRTLHRAIAAGLVRSCHDLSEGGLAVAAAEMALAGRMGLHIHLSTVPVEAQYLSDGLILFSESLSRFLVEVAPEQRERFLDATRGLPVGELGRVTRAPTLLIDGLERPGVVNLPIDRALDAFKGHFHH